MKRFTLLILIGFIWVSSAQTVKHFLDTKNAYFALGALGQSISVFPEIDVVVAYKTNSAYEKSNSARIVQLLLMNAIKLYEPK